MATYYYISTTNIQEIYKKNELIKALDNLDYRSSKIQVTKYSRVTKIRWLNFQDGYIHLSLNDDAVTTILSDKDIACLRSQAHTWFQQQCHLESLAIKYENTHLNSTNPYGNRWSGQMHYLANNNLLGQPASIRLDPTVTRPHNPSPKTKSHTTFHFYGQGRTGHAQSTFARENHQAKINIQSLINDYPGNVVRHRNRKFNRKHSCEFPVFDDSEYTISRHSTGWKYSSKARHQYDQHKRHNWTLPHSDKRQLSHIYNDWTADDEFDAAGGDYYAESWWYQEPDPNLTPMSDKIISQNFYNSHDPSKNLRYITNLAG